MDVKEDSILEFINTCKNLEWDKHPNIFMMTKLNLKELKANAKLP